MLIIWANKSEWKKPGPIVAMGVTNAWACAEAGHETHFFVGAGDEAGSDTERELEEFYGVPPRENLTVHRVRSGGKWAEILGRKLYREALALADRMVNEGKQVLFVTRELGLVPLLGRLRKKSRGKLIAFHETHDFHTRLDHLESVDWTRRRKSWTERRFLPGMDGLICITEEQAALYRGAFPGLPVRMLPLGTTEFERESIEVRRARRTVGYVGHLHSSKGVHGILKMVPHFADAGVKLALYGGYPEQIDSLKRRLLEIDSRTDEMVKLQPFMPPAELHRALGQDLSLMLVPLKDNHYNRFLTCPVKALDALSHGIPSVASDLPSTKGVLGESAIYAEPGKVKATAKAAIAVLDDPGRYETMAKEAERLAAELAWPKRADRIVEFALSASNG
ncbi:MAG: glycosyltransferase family 4 protein [Verrucomicrobiota bacterium]